MTSERPNLPPGARAGELERIQEAFQLFDSQSRTLQAAFDKLRTELAQANRDLNAKNQALSQKVNELQQLTSRLNCILESLTDGVLVVGETMTVEHCNAAAARLLNTARDAVEGRPYPEVARELSNPEAIRRALREGETLCDEKRRGHRAQGDEGDVLASVAPIRSPDGSIIGAVEVLRDVTELVALERRVQHRERMAALGEMAAGVAHEIRNPLGTIEGFARLLRRDLEGQPNHKRLADKIVEGAQNLNYVITNLLTYVRPMALQEETFEVNKLLLSVAEGLAGGATTHGVTLEVVSRETDFQLSADIRQLRQVLLNIGLNAIEACEVGGRVTVQAERAGAEVRFRVADTGCGIAPEHLERIFDPFFTLKQGGTGLGLSLCHKIVAAHNGRIEVTSRPEHGATFEVILPNAAARRGQNGAGRASQPAGGIP